MNKSLKNRILGILAICTTTLISACAPMIPPCDGVPSAPLQDLAATQWTLLRWYKAPVGNDSPQTKVLPRQTQDAPLSITFTPDGKKASGSTGCNYFNATVVSMDRGGIYLEKIATTRKACAPALEDIEFEYISVLGNLRQIVRDGDRLLLVARDKQVLSFSLRTK